MTSDVIVETTMDSDAFNVLFDADELEIDDYKEIRIKDGVFLRIYPTS